jgi:hypothetical protein
MDWCNHQPTSDRKAFEFSLALLFGTSPRALRERRPTRQVPCEHVVAVTVGLEPA